MKYEIIVADDGSRDNHEEELNKLFAEYQFSDYKLIMHPGNQGTVKNLLSGVLAAEGKYTKPISPGDRLVCDDTLKSWMDFMDEKKCSWSFSDAVYYTNQDGKDIYVNASAHPQDVKPYLRQDIQKCRWNYIVLNDIALGAAVFCRTDIICECVKKLVEYGIIYAEDNMWRFLMFVGDVGCYYQNDAIYYEYGTGISTSGSELFAQKLRKDWQNAGRMMDDVKNPDKFQQKMLRCIKKSNSIFGKIFIKGNMYFKIHSKFHQRMTKCQVSNNWREKRCK